MDDAIRQAIADLSALIKDADSVDAERIREVNQRRRHLFRRSVEAEFS